MEEKDKDKDKPKKKGMLSSIMPRSPVRNYQVPILHDIATKIVVDDMEFLPRYQENIAYVDLMCSEDLRIPANGTEIVDCGFSMEIPAGYKVIVEAPVLKVVKWESSYKFEVTVYNAGYEEHHIPWGSVFAQMYIEPVYRFDWKF